jgi:hypothetical protein
MTRIIAALAASAALAVASPARAQDAARGDQMSRFGLGVGFSNQSVASFRVAMNVPMQGRPGFLRVEPFLSLSRNTADLSATVEEQRTSADLGATVSYAVPIFPYAFAHAGARLGIAYRSEKEESSTTTIDDSGTGFLLGAVAGGEVLIHPRLGLGVEAGLGYRSTPELEKTVGGTPFVLQRKSSGWGTSGEVLLRFYFQ